MKKTLVALAVTAFAASSASAATIYENEGTKVDFGGSVRVILQKNSHKVGEEKSTGHSTLKNAGSRFNVRVKHDINENLYALGYYETRFNSGSKNDAAWGDIVTNKAYVGLGTQSGHLVTFGKQAVIGDDIGRAGYDKTFDVGTGNINGFKSDILTKETDSSVQYKYTGIQGLTLAAHYDFANETNRENAKDTEADKFAYNNLKAGYGAGAIYDLAIAEGQSASFALGYSHRDYVSGDNLKNNYNGIYGGFAYRINQFEVAVDGGRGTHKAGDDSTKINYVRAGARYDVTPAVGVYANYSYGTVKESATDWKNTAHQYMLGTDYQLHKQVVTYVEGRVIKQKDNAQQSVKRTDKAIGVGMRVFW